MMMTMMFALIFNVFSDHILPISFQLMYTVVHKNVALYFYPYLRQLLLTDFLNFFTGTLCKQFAIM